MQIIDASSLCSDFQPGAAIPFRVIIDEVNKHPPHFCPGSPVILNIPEVTFLSNVYFKVVFCLKLVLLHCISLTSLISLNMYFLILWQLISPQMSYSQLSSNIAQEIIAEQKLKNNILFYAPNFEEVEEAYWFGPVCPSIRLWVMLALGQEQIEIIRILKFGLWDEYEN